MTPDEALEQATAVGVGAWLIPGVGREGWPLLTALAGKDSRVLAAPGLHPMMAAQWDRSAASGLADLLTRPQCVAVGEIGLDGLIDVDMAQQEAAFVGQLRLAIETGRPVIIHCRKAWGRLLDILRAEQAQRVGGILHAFGSSLEIARQAVALNFAIGFGGPLTWPNANKRIAVLKGLPAEAIVIETDAPDLPPHPHRGKVNRPEWLPLVAQKVAQLRNWSPEETARITSANARRVLQWQQF